MTGENWEWKTKQRWWISWRIYAPWLLSVPESHPIICSGCEPRALPPKGWSCNTRWSAPVTRTQGSTGSLRLWKPEPCLCSQGLELRGSGFERVTLKSLTAKAHDYAIKGVSLPFCNFHLSRKHPQLFVTKALELLKLKLFSIDFTISENSSCSVKLQGLPSNVPWIWVKPRACFCSSYLSWTR